MSKNKSIFDLAGVDPVVEVSKHLSKKGKLKGNKKQVNNLKSICTHHAINRKGKIKPRIDKDDNGHGKNCRCQICNEKFRTGFYTKQEWDQGMRIVKPMISQGKFVLQAIGADKEAIREVCKTNLLMDNYWKIYNRATSVASKQGKQKKKKKKINRNQKMGGWRLNR